MCIIKRLRICKNISAILNAGRYTYGRFFNLSPLDEARVQRFHREIDIFDGLATHYMDREYIQLLKQTGVNAVHYTVAFTTLVHKQTKRLDRFGQALFFYEDEYPYRISSSASRNRSR